ncbi:hypothetical protein ACRXB1_28930, partial [Caballeronia sp. M23-90]
MDLQHPPIPELPSASLAGTPTRAPVSPQQLRRAILTGAVGSALEYYDFAIFGLASALVFSHIFFPALGAKAGLLASFGTYGAGFLARPFGGLFFGSIGDRKGRKFVLLVTIAIMGTSTMLIGLLPSGTIGAVSLVVLRLVHSFGTYGAGFLARPFGGLFFGPIGDRKGRKFVLLVTIAIMGTSTMLIGLLPSGTIGAVSLVVLR